MKQNGSRPLDFFGGDVVAQQVEILHLKSAYEIYDDCHLIHAVDLQVSEINFLMTGNAKVGIELVCLFTSKVDPHNQIILMQNSKENRPVTVRGTALVKISNSLRQAFTPIESCEGRNIHVQKLIVI